MQTPLAIDVRHATVAANGTEILRDLTWQVARGERWFILGANGAGKTTLVKTILGLVWPRRGGNVAVLGCRYGQDDLQAARDKIAWASPFLSTWMQSDGGENMTVLDAVLTGADASVQRYRAATAGENERARAALEKMGAAHLAARPFARCSSGEQVKALIARAMMRDPELLILDETCVHLDLQSREALLAAVDGLAAAAPATTMLFVTQRLEEITPTFAQGLILAGGRIAAQGPRAEILTSENLRLAFPGLSLRLLPGPGGRLWPLPE